MPTSRPAWVAFDFAFPTLRRQAALQNSSVSQSRAVRRENLICLPHTLHSRRGIDSPIIGSTFVSDINTLAFLTVPSSSAGGKILLRLVQEQPPWVLVLVAHRCEHWRDFPELRKILS